MLFFSFFKTLVGKEVVVELKNDLSISGSLQFVDQFLNMKLADVATASDVERYPHLLSVKSCFVRGSVVRYIHLKADYVDAQQLQENTRKEFIAARTTVDKKKDQGKK